MIIVTCRSLYMSRITIKFRKNPKNPMRKSTKAETTYPHLGMRRGNSSYGLTIVSFQLTGNDVILNATVPPSDHFTTLHV